jgi:hypothetical protein
LSRSWLRATAYLTVLPWILVCAMDTRYGGRYWLGLVLSSALVAWFVGRRAPPWLSRAPARALELLAWNLLLAFVCAEVGLRVWGAVGSPPTWLDDAPDSMRYRLDPARDWLGTRPNSHGFYDAEHALAKPSGVLRVVALGDSYTVGMVPFGESYIARVNAAIGPSVEVLNLGVVHTAVPEYEETLRGEALSFDPDLVLLGLYVGNDIRRAPSRGLFSPVGSKAVVAARVLARIWASGAPYRQSLPGSILYQTAADGSRVEVPLMTVEQHVDRAQRHLERLFREPQDGRMLEAWGDTEAALRRLVALCRGLGLPVLATLAPEEIQVDDALFARVVARMGERPEAFDRDYPNRRLRALLAALDVPVLDLTAALRAAEASAHTYHPRGVHWNAHGNAAAADAVASWLAERIAALAGDRKPAASTRDDEAGRATDRAPAAARTVPQTPASG